MAERRREVLEEQVFIPVFGEDGNFPPAPPEAVEKYRNFRDVWLPSYPKIPGVEPEVVLRPVGVDGGIHYLVTKQIIIVGDLDF